MACPASEVLQHELHADMAARAQGVGQGEERSRREEKACELGIRGNDEPDRLAAERLEQHVDQVGANLQQHDDADRDEKESRYCAACSV
jgi:hypothetical protein